MTTAFVLAGGGSLGAVQVGMLQALAAHGIRPDLMVGTSAGAMNAAWVAGHGPSERSLAGLAEVWSGLHRADVFPLDLRVALRGLFGLSPALSTSRRLAGLVESHLVVETLQEAVVPVHLVATDLLSGLSVTLSDGPVLTGVLASSAVPGVFPPVLRGGRHLVDGGVGPHTGIKHAVDLGADVVYVLPTGAPCALPGVPRSAVGAAVHALALMMTQRLAHEVSELSGQATIRILPPLCPLRVSAADFGHGAELVDRGRSASLDWIAEGGIDLPAPERFLAAHDHRPGARAERDRPGSPDVSRAG